MSGFASIIEKLGDSLVRMSPEEASAAIDAAIKDAGIQGVRKERTESQDGPYCPDGKEYRTCYWVEHGDGSKSDEWCTNWGCR